jgi:hypothetical protein
MNQAIFLGASVRLIHYEHRYSCHWLQTIMAELYRQSTWRLRDVCFGRLGCRSSSIISPLDSVQRTGKINRNTINIRDVGSLGLSSESIIKPQDSILLTLSTLPTSRYLRLMWSPSCLTTTASLEPLRQVSVPMTRCQLLGISPITPRKSRFIHPLVVLPR